jgi:hypothetical protein
MQWLKTELSITNKNLKVIIKIIEKIDPQKQILIKPLKLWNLLKGKWKGTLNHNGVKRNYKKIKRVSTNQGIPEAETKGWTKTKLRTKNVWNNPL